MTELKAAPTWPDCPGETDVWIAPGGSGIFQNPGKTTMRVVCRNEPGSGFTQNGKPLPRRPVQEAPDPWNTLFVGWVLGVVSASCVAVAAMSRSK